MGKNSPNNPYICPMLSARLSLLAYVVCAVLITGSAFFYYPKWQNTGTESTISWDASGYYFYLPAIFIYKDVKYLGFKDSILTKYRPTPVLQQAFQHSSGNFVLKYSIGQSLQLLPWFAVAHVLAGPLGYPADGFSKPYQAAVSWGSLLIALLGLWYLRRSLLRYYADAVTAAVLLCLTFGTNYLNYTAFDGAMTHNWLFTLYSLLIWTTIRFYEAPSWQRAALIGLWCGWAMLTRPTEIVAVLIPLGWGMALVDWRTRVAFLAQHWQKLAVALVVGAAVGFIQPLYWHYATGDWIVYSYEDQGFSWLKPHVQDGAFSFRAGWLTYTPMMFLAVFGLVPLYRRQATLFPGIALFCVLFMYICWAWDIWWYGGSLGQRAMVQSYPVWAFPLAAMIEWLMLRTWGQLAFPLVAGLFIWNNLWWTHQAHRGDGLFISEQMTKAFFWKVIGRSELDRDDLKLLDTKEYWRGTERRNPTQLYGNDFETETGEAITTEGVLNGSRSLRLDGQHQWSPEYSATLNWPATHAGRTWLRATCTFECKEKEWDWWRMSQFIVRFYKGDQILKERMIRLQRHVDGTEKKTMWFDTAFPMRDFDRVAVLFWNADSDKTVRIDDVGFERFE
jgi:Dolichyl-phosphate-mannose-protein mannosyltransferase